MTTNNDSNRARAAVSAAVAAVSGASEQADAAERPAASAPTTRIAAARSTPEMSDRVRATMDRFLKGDMEVDDLDDRFYIHPDKIPEGTTYEWKRGSLYGKEDVTYSATLERGGWTPVEAARHPEMMPAGYKGYIERDGCVLMERPSVITDHVRVQERRAARELIKIKEQEARGETPTGTLSRTEVAVQQNTIGFRRNYAPAPAEIPDA